MVNNDLKYYLSNKDQYFNNDPFPHWVIDGMFNEKKLNKISSTPDLLKNALKAQSDGWGISVFDNELEGKIGINNVSSNKVQDYLKYLNSEIFINFLTEMTGINNLVPDNEYIGGGLHMIPKGGRLGVHIDFTKHQNMPDLWRRCNVLLYLNKGWKNEWNGHLELWDNPRKKGGKCVKKIKPLFNRLVIFGTLRSSWHGHPENLKCPDNRMRCSLATYYYSKESSEDNREHSTIFAENI